MCEPDQTSHRLGENGWEGGKLHGRERTTNFYWTVKKEMNNCQAPRSTYNNNNNLT